MKPEFTITFEKKQKKLPKKEKIGIYVCGPTVYNHIHIGNARPLVVFDILFRLLKYLEYDVEYVQNVTDVDDKIINIAKEEQVNETIISEKFTKEYNKICELLNAQNFSQELVSKNMDRIINFVQRLVENGKAYIDEDPFNPFHASVYFDISKYQDYGLHSTRISDDINSENNSEPFIIKENIITGVSPVVKQQRIIRLQKFDKSSKNENFVLWKSTNVGLNWKSPWSFGRPGWHTECAVLVEKRFGNNLTIHGGGIDLIFPHHENEIAQFSSLHGNKLAKYWMYVGHVMVGDDKMSKSLKNFVYAKDILKNYEGNTIRWWFMSVGMLLPIKYTAQNFAKINDEWQKIVKTINKAKSQIYLNNLNFSETQEIHDKALEKLINNLDTANFVTEIQSYIKKINTDIKLGNFSTLSNYVKILQNTLEMVGFVIKDIHDEKNVQLLKEWKQLLDKKQYKEADIIREKLIKLGLI